MISIFVTIRIKSGFFDRFVDAVYDDGKGSVRDEDGCFRFDVLKNSSTQNTIHLYEVYRDNAALEAHRSSPHYIKWRSTVEPWFDGPPERVEMETLFPSDEGWEHQKPSLLKW